MPTYGRLFPPLYIFARSPMLIHCHWSQIGHEPDFFGCDLEPCAESASIRKDVGLAKF